MILYDALNRSGSMCFQTVFQPFQTSCYHAFASAFVIPDLSNILIVSNPHDPSLSVMLDGQDKDGRRGIWWDGKFSYLSDFLGTR